MIDTSSESIEAKTAAVIAASTEDDAAVAAASAAASPTSLRYRAHTRWRHYAIAGLIGLVVGLVATAFREALFAVEHGRDLWVAWGHAHLPHVGWMILPVVGGLLCAFVGYLMRFCPEAGGSGIPHLKAVLLGVRTLDYRRMIPVKFAGGVLAIGSGMALGREGPTVQMGAGVGQAIAQWLDVPPTAIPQLLSCGAGAGLAAAFNAPLAGLIFVIEELHRELSSRTFVGALIATIVATAVTQGLTGASPSFEIRDYPMLPLWALPGTVLLGAAGGAIGAAFNASLMGLQRRSLAQRLLPRWSLPMIVAIGVGLVAWWFPIGIGGGHGPAEILLRYDSPLAKMGILALLGWIVVRFIATTFCYATGVPGGIFAPMLLIGAILGTAFGRAAAGAFPALHNNGQAFAVLGMAAMFVGSVRAPLTGIILICEMTHNYDQLFGLCVTCLSAHLVAELLRGEPVYDQLMEADLHRSGIQPAAEARTVYLGVQLGSALASKSIRSAGLPKGAMIVAIERSGRSIAPLADVELQAGDHIVVSVAAANPAIAMRMAELCLPTIEAE